VADEEKDVKGTPEATEESQDKAPAPELSVDDLKAALADKEKEFQKLQNDLRSRDGVRRKQEENDARLGALADEVKAMRKVTAAVLDALQRGDTEGAQSKIADIDNQVASSHAVRTAQQRADRERQRLMQTVQDGDTLLVSEDDAAKLQGMWRDAVSKAEAGDWEAMSDMQIEAGRMVNAHERRKAQSELRKAREEAKQEHKRVLEKHGINELDTGSAIAGGGPELHGTALIERGLVKTKGSVFKE